MRVAIAMAVAFALAPAAVAQPPGAGLPDEAAAVAGPTGSGARLYVWDHGGFICASAVGRRDRHAGERCVTPTEGLRDPTISTDDLTRTRHRVWGIVAAQVASVEVVLGGGRRLHAPTSAGERYRGRRAGTLRFFLLEASWPRTDDPLYVRLLGQDGALLAAVAVEGDEGGRRGRATPVASGRVGRGRWSLRAFTRPALAPLPGDEERVVTRRCLQLTVHGGRRFTQAGGSSCDDPDYDRRPLIDVGRSCAPVGVRAVGLVRPGVRVDAVLGDGGRVRPRLFALPRRFGALRAFALTLAPDVALRSLATVEGGRRQVQIGGIGPGLADCPDTASGWVFGLALGLPRFGPGPPTLQLRDDGLLLCATLGLPDPDGLDCSRPPLGEDQSWVLHHATPQSTTVAGVVPLQVASVEVVFAGEAGRVVPTTTESAYAGRYRGLIRVFSVAIPGEHKPRAVRLNGVAGERLATIPVHGPPEVVRSARPVLSSPGGWRVAAGVVAYPAAAGRRFSCLELTRGEPSDDPLSCSTGKSKQARVACRPRRTLVYGQVNPRERRVEVRTDRGTIEARSASLRRLGISGRAFLAELPGGAALRGVVVHGERVRRLRLRLPRASSQCGYEEPVSFR